MILGSLVGLSLIVTVSADAAIQPELGKVPAAMTSQQKGAVMQPLVRAATECVLHSVVADSRLPASLEAADVRDIIITSMPPCADSMRAMIEAHDQLYGEGSGQVFFMGPYLDMLPVTVIKAVKANTSK